ncbi:hypothetical protein ALT_6593 [Aspergillus lentulus]|uniref:Uncharacterized protein n=1 Tax=Aspergillus lentulus TaxID=293939 RepID=A0AAN4PMW1_ASPLE|nr:hypothetical protein ALT_6593 [Aspergillus lentulus]
MIISSDSTPHFLLDALSECDQRDPGIRDLRLGISETLSITNKVKWLLSGPPEIDIYKKPRIKEAPGAEVEIDSPKSTGAGVLGEMEEEIHLWAQNTFLWVSLIFKDIIENDLREYEAVERVKASPPSLTRLNDRMMAKIKGLGRHDAECCRGVLAAACLASRSLSYAKIHVLAG